MTANTLAKIVSGVARSLSANPSRGRLCLQVDAAAVASANTYGPGWTVSRPSRPKRGFSLGWCRQSAMCGPMECGREPPVTSGRCRWRLPLGPALDEAVFDLRRGNRHPAAQVGGGRGDADAPGREVRDAGRERPAGADEVVEPACDLEV